MNGTRRVKISFELVVSELVTDQELLDWLDFQLDCVSTLSGQNPLRNTALSCEPYTLEIEPIEED